MSGQWCHFEKEVRGPYEVLEGCGCAMHRGATCDIDLGFRSR